MNDVASMVAAQGRDADAGILLRETPARTRRALGENHPMVDRTLYNLACVAARLGDRHAALDWLGQSTAHGYSDAARLAADPDLKPLRGDPAFEALVAKARQNAGR